jgi:hypothetical protein
LKNEKKAMQSQPWQGFKGYVPHLDLRVNSLKPVFIGNNMFFGCEKLFKIHGGQVGFFAPLVFDPFKPAWLLVAKMGLLQNP